jgi:putative tricarboxylic transport membrane protein
MMGLLDHLALGLNVAFTATNLFYCFTGVFIGTLIGVLPGIGPAGTMAMLLPFSFGISPASAIIMLAGIFYGAQYGGSTTAILVNIPGESSSVMTCLDGYQMARKGRAGPALGIAAFGSFIAGTVGIVVVMMVAQPLLKFTLNFGPPEFFSLMVLSLTIVTYLAMGSMLKALIMAVLGFSLGQIGMDIVTGQVRFSFGILELEGGLDLVPIVMGLFGISEVLISLEESADLSIYKGKIKNLLPNLQDWKDSIAPIFRGTVLGFFVGMLPGGTATVAGFASYAVEKKISKHPEKFGTGTIEGVAGPESANNAASSGCFIPLFSLGIPSNAVTAMLLGSLMMHGVQPGPLLIQRNPEIFWGTIMSMYIGNVMLLILNLPLISIWVRLLKVPYRILFPLILLFCIIGSYSVGTSRFDVLMMATFGVIGYVFRKLDYEAAPLVMAFILSPTIENSLRQSLLMSRGTSLIFFTRPISLVCLIVAGLVLASSIVLRKRAEAILK